MTRDRDNSFNPFNNQVAGKNFLVNGGFDVWQRGTTWTGTPTANTIFYATADRWFHAVGTGSFSATFERVMAENSDSTYGIKFGRNSGAGNNAAPSIIGQAIESLNAKRLAGKTVTLSFYAKTLSSFGNSMQVYLISGTGTDQSSQSIFGAGYTGSSIIFNPGQPISTTMSRYTFTGTVPANSNQLAVMFALYITPATAGANEYVQMENIQLEIGSNATQFSRSGGTIGGELALCQRYYWQTTSSPNGAVTLMTGGLASGTATVAQLYCALPSPMRAIPTASISTTNLQFWDATGGGSGYSVGSINAQNSSIYQGTLNIASSGLTNNNRYNLLALTGSTGYLAFSAEL